MLGDFMHYCADVLVKLHLKRMLERWRRAANRGIKRNDTRGGGANAAEHPRANWMKDSDSPKEIQGSDYPKSRKPMRTKADGT